MTPEAYWVLGQGAGGMGGCLVVSWQAYKHVVQITMMMNLPNKGDVSGCMGCSKGTALGYL